MKVITFTHSPCGEVHGALFCLAVSTQKSVASGNIDAYTHCQYTQTVYCKSIRTVVIVLVD